MILLSLLAVHNTIKYKENKVLRIKQILIKQQGIKQVKKMDLMLADSEKPAGIKMF